ncbi:hypothetical protein HPB48_014205 [Haemaphysalis longicornis]|uniref:Uncharacterized protein n=1 Tax=Haemaphysalis longicornis TaxID=44386 RepID=A0A9J6FJ24_HAELO|nr:hypothetical protein HPB48_014205 [Haemaphysalis longicornis]
MRGWALVGAVLLSARALPEDDSPATPDYEELELGGEPVRNRTGWDTRFVDAEGRFLAKIMSTFILSKDLLRSFDYRIAKPALDIAVTKVGFLCSSHAVEALFGDFVLRFPQGLVFNLCLEIFSTFLGNLSSSIP